jgi:hypothetical protein
MIVWLDNNENHDEAINENYGRELLELFSMGIGNYTEEDIKECSRAFTGWTLGNAEYMSIRAAKDSIWPYGRIAWHFDYREQDHDDGEKTFLGETGRFNGEDIIAIIAGSFERSTSRFSKLPMPDRRNMSTWLSRERAWLSLAYPVAKRPCQNKAVFSSSGHEVLIMRYIQ